ncbi:MAG: LamG-like jellyroll fold domain-containing protein [Planctomycetia bacterium]|nr:LamG-like jellyroll fold domain-containing protein [Planctomycetia bacterium]
MLRLLMLTRQKLITTLAFASTFFTFTNVLLAQLPPTLHRVSVVDSAVDIPDLASENLLVPSFVPDFGTALRPDRKSFIIEGRPEYNTRPLTVEFWGRVDSAKEFQIFVANDVKSSARHWEIYTFAGSGCLSLYIPGNQGDTTLTSNRNLVDGRAHYIGVTLDVDKASLYVDGECVGSMALNWDNGVMSEEARFAIGSLVEKTLFCNGLIDELRVSRGIREFSTETIPTSPLDNDAQTLLLSHFTRSPQTPLSEQTCSLVDSLASTVPNQEPLPNERFADTPKYLVSPRDPDDCSNLSSYYDLGLDVLSTKTTVDLSGALAESYQNEMSTEQSVALDHLFPSGALEISVAPNDKPAKGIPVEPFDRDAFDARAKELGFSSLKACDFRDGVVAKWGEDYLTLQGQLRGEIVPPRGAAEQTLDPNALVYPATEKVPVQATLRRVRAMLDSDSFNYDDAQFLATVDDFERLESHVQTLINDAEYLSGSPESTVDYFLARALGRRIMFAQEELEDLNDILFLARGCYAGSRLTNRFNTDRIGGHMSTQVYGFNTIHGGGIFSVSDWKTNEPRVVDLIGDKKVVATPLHSRLAGTTLSGGSFYKPELSYDGETIYFSWNHSQEHRWIWTPETTWSIFKTRLDSDEIEQLTDGSYNDFDVCETPEGRLVFCSERRGGFIRCFGEDASLRVTTSVMHSMKNDGSDIYPISYFETSEWHPTVDNNGALVYSRWDYVDRENCLGSTFWTCMPDGRNPRSPQGNYPYPWDTFEDNVHGDHRFGDCSDAPSGLPMTQMQFRAIPGSHKYIFTAAPHHGESFGSLCLLDLRVPNDNHMSQIKRITPYEPFPESETVDRSQYRYGAPWALSEDLYLCNSWEDLVLLDRYGNEELICERELLPIGYDPRVRLSEPIPLRPRVKPPVIAHQTAQGEDYRDRDKSATIGVVNINLHDREFPADRPIKRLRVLQVIPKSNPWMDTPFIGYATENTPRIPLGTVPVEEDGSVYFEAPYGKQLIFQALDENNMAVQTMRSVAFVHPGEKLVCVGCHEPQDESVPNDADLSQPIAFQRAPSKLEPECGSVEPINYYRLIQPLVQEKCISCHVEKDVPLQSMNHEDLRPYVYYYSGSMRHGTMHTGSHGGSRSRPGRVGASEAKLGSILFDENHLATVSDEDRHKFILWLDANALRLGAFQDEEAQMRGELVWPLLDVEPCQEYTPVAETK